MGRIDGRNAKEYEERKGTSRCLRHIIIITIDKEEQRHATSNTDRQGPKSTDPLGLIHHSHHIIIKIPDTKQDKR